MRRLLSALKRFVSVVGRTGALPTGDPVVKVSEEGIELTEPTGPSRRIAWSSIECVTWFEPDYGYLGGTPYWRISGGGTSIQFDDPTYSGEGELADWLGRKLPGYDSAIVKAALDRGELKASGRSWLQCWPHPADSE